MPRFFPSFGNRSRQTREQRPHDEYDRYDDYGQQHQQSPRVPTTAWSRVVPKGKSREHLNPDSSWDEDVFLERPDSYTGHGAYPNGTRIPVPGTSSASSSSTAYLNQDDGHDDTHHRQRRPSRPAMMMPVRDRDDAAYLSDSTAAEEEYDNGSGHYAPDNTIPIVQRESSLTRLQEAFADHGLSAGSTRPVTELNLPQQQSTPIFQSAPVSLSGGPGPSSMAYSLSQSGIRDPYGHHVRSSPRHDVLPPVGQVYGNATAELRNVYPEQHLPTLVPNMATANSQRGDVYAGSAPSSHLRRRNDERQSQSRRAREKRPQTGYRAPDEYAYTKVGFGSEYDSEYGTGYEDGYERDAYEPERSQTRDRYRDYRSEYREEQRPRVRRNSSASSRSLGDSDDQEYPPCVVVVERGRHGKKDTYYVIPGGAPVIFEDAKGNELTRVGDFTGRYRPRRQRPVIIEDSHGREIGRLGFDDESSLDYPYRHASSNSSGSEEGFYDRNRGSGYARQRSYRDDVHVSSSRHSSKHPPREDGRYSPPRGRSPPSNSSANVVYIPYTSSSTRAPSRHSGKSSRSGTGIREREYRDRDRDDAPYTYEPSTGSRSRSSHSHASRASSSQQVIHLDDHYTRQMSQSRSAASSRSSGRRSHDSDRRL